MAQQQHSSEIVVSIDDTQVARAVRGLTEQFKGLQQSAQQAVQQAGQAATQAGQRVAQTAHTATGGLSTEAAAAGVYAGRGAMAVGGAVGRGAMAAGSSLANLAGAAIPFAGGIARSLISTRMARTGEAQSLEIPQTELRFGGGYGQGQIGSARRVGASFGMTPQETVQMLQGFSAQVGERFQLQGATLRNVMEAQRFGVSSRAFAGFGAGGALGGGAMSGNIATETELALRVARVGREMGLSGGGVERLLASISQATQSMASQGLTLDTESTSRFMQAVSISAEIGGSNALQGEGAMRAVNRVQGMTGGALQSFRGQFGQIGQGALQAAAARNARSPLEMIQNLEAMMSDPRRAVGALSEMGLPPELQQLALVGAGASTEQARYLLQGMDPLADSLINAPARMGLSGESVTGGLALSRASAMRSNELVSVIETNKKASLAMIRLSAQMEKMALNMTTNDAVLTKLLTGLQTTVDEAFRPGGTVEELTDAVKSFIAFVKKYAP